MEPQNQPGPDESPKETEAAASVSATDPDGQDLVTPVDLLSGKQEQLSREEYDKLLDMYDTSFRPGDTRTLTCEQVITDDGDPRIEQVQDKTDEPHFAPLWPETVALIERYKAEMGIAWVPTATLIRTRRGRPYTKDRLSRDIRIIMRAAGIPDAVQARDLRRTASMERAKADSTEYELASGTGHSFSYGSRMRDTYNPRSFDAAKRAQDKRRRNRKRPSDGKALAE